MSHIAKFFRDPEYYRQLMRLTLPMALQNFITSLLNLVAFVLIGQLGETSVAAVGLANQIWFLLNLVTFGMVSGSAIFIAQLWGKQDIANIKRVTGLTFKLSLLIALFFGVIAIFLPRFALGIYSNDPDVIEIGSHYLRIYGWSYFFYALTSVYSSGLRSTGNVRLPLIVGTSALGLNVLIAYPMIFGIRLIGLPAMGVEGAALAGLIARILECGVLMSAVYRDPRNPVAASLRDILSLDLKFMGAVMNPVFPVILNEALWSFGVTTYNVIYGHIHTNAVAAINITATIEQLAFVFFLSFGTATGIAVGNWIGRGDREKAFQYAGRSLLIQGVAGIIMGLCIYLVGARLINFYKVSPEVIADAGRILTVLSIGFWVKTCNHVVVIGILRAGGDTRFSLFLDGFIIWIVGVPALACGAFILDWPIHLVYALTFCEESVKFILGARRFISKRWIHDLTDRVENNAISV